MSSYLACGCLDVCDVYSCWQCSEQSLRWQPSIYSGIPSNLRFGKPVLDYRCVEAANMNAFAPGIGYGGAPIYEAPRDKKPVLKTLFSKLKPKAKQKIGRELPAWDIEVPANNPVAGVKRSNAKLIRKAAPRKDASKSTPNLAHPNLRSPSIPNLNDLLASLEDTQDRSAGSPDVSRTGYGLFNFGFASSSSNQSLDGQGKASGASTSLDSPASTLGSCFDPSSHPSLAWLFKDEDPAEIADAERHSWEQLAKRLSSLEIQGSIPGAWQNVWNETESSDSKKNANPDRRRKLSAFLQRVWNEAQDGELHDVLQFPNAGALALSPTDSGIAFEHEFEELPPRSKGKEPEGGSSSIGDKSEDMPEAEAFNTEKQIQEEKDAKLALKIMERFEIERQAVLLAKSRKRECVVCGDEKDPLEFLATRVTSKCDHKCQVCKECIASWLESEFDTKGTEGIKCPECPQVLQYHEMQRAASAKTFEAYDRITTRNALASLPNFAWCLGPDCDSGQLNIENHNFMECISCHYKQCIKHSCAWHQDENCTQYDYRTSGKKARDEEAATQKMINDVSKTCPGKGCGWRIQKIDGCDHMTCRRCRHEFCWQCMAPQSEIKRVGNTAHEKDCKFHSHNLDLAWPFNVHAGVNRAAEV